MSGSAFELQKGVYALLSGSPGLTCPVYDHVPQTSAKPYAVVGDGDADEWGTADSDGDEVRVAVTAYSDQHRGRKGVKQVQADVYQILHHTLDLAVTGYQVVLIHYLDSDSPPTPDGATYESTARYRVLLSKL